VGNKDVPESNIQSQPKSNAADSGKSSVDFVYRRPANIIDDFIARLVLGRIRYAVITDDC